MKCVRGSFVAETEVKRSRFIAHLVPYSVFDGLQKQLKEEHPKANHVAYAYRHINKYGRVVEKSSDDGEPKGCAGVPILNLMRGLELVESAILVVRYFGGIRLGTGGMVRAYGAAARAVVASAEFSPWQTMILLCFRSDFASQRRVYYVAKHLGISPVVLRYEAEGVVWAIEASRSAADRFLEETGGIITLLSHCRDEEIETPFPP